MILNINPNRLIGIFLTVFLFEGKGLDVSAAPILNELHPLADPAPLQLNAVSAVTAGSLSNGEFRVKPLCNPKQKFAVFYLRPEKGAWDCGGKLWIVMDIFNQGRSPFLVQGKIRSTSALPWVGGAVTVPPRQQRSLPLLIVRKIPETDEENLKRLFGDVRGVPGGHQRTGWVQLDAGAITGVNLEFFPVSGQIDCTVSNLRAAVDFKLPDPAGTYMPAVDRFGQELTHDWPSKIKTEQDFKRAEQAEKTWLEDHPPLSDRSRYGGWNAGPRFMATGNFYTKKFRGKWWLIDPDGYLFWSLGITGVDYTSDMTTTPRLGQVLKNLSPAKLQRKDFPVLKGDFWNPYQANLRRKYGLDWKKESIAVAHERLHAWGINTLGNWSDSAFCKAHKTSYVTAVHYSRATLDGSDIKYGNNLPDVFHPEFREKTLKRMESEIPETASDPWCIGYFIDNELSFGTPVSPAVESLRSATKCYSRLEFIRQLQVQYGELRNLNAAWGSSFGKWDELAPLAGDGNTDAYKEDLRRFSEEYYHRYYKTCQEAVQSAAPGKLYLGSRINHVQNSTALRICGEYADVISINLYEYTPDTFKLPDGVDKPVIIGEFHFGTITEQGVWGAGLKFGMDIKQCADLFQSYVQAALRNPMIVGAHWFQLVDQPLTGRHDGENYRIGFLNAADIPYPEMTEAARATSEGMYGLRSQSINKRANSEKE